ncbi:MAG: T9SS type A sorting domain-containing protein [Chitinophagaceae bacterium]|jgi:hypothetical protein
MKNISLLLIASIYFLNSSAQSHKFEWASSIGGTKGAELNHCSSTDSKGNLYTGGAFAGEADFDPGAGYHFIMSKNIDAYITKLDADGNFYWVKTIPSRFQSAITSITTDTTGNIYISGSYEDSISFEIGSVKQSAYSGNENIFYAKLDSNGNFLWIKTLKNELFKPGSSRKSKVKLDHNSDLIITGCFQDRVDFDAGADSFFIKATTYYNETFILKTNASGEFIWVKNFAGTRLSNECHSFDVDSRNNIFLCGHFDDTIDVNPATAINHLISKGDNDMFLVKLDNAGNYIWSKQFGEKRTDEGSCISVTRDDNLLMAGHFTDSIKIVTDTGLLKIKSNLNNDAILMKFSNDGQFKWYKKFQGKFSSVEPVDLKQDPADNIYLMGSFSGNIDFDPAEDSFYIQSYYNGVFLTKFDSTGSFIYAKIIEPNNRTFIPPTLSIDKSSNIFLCGNFTERMDANPSVDSFILSSFDSDDYDAFSIKLSNCTPSKGFDTIIACGSYTLAGQEYTSSGNFKKYLINSTGCDSTLQLNLTILPKPSASITHISVNTIQCNNSGVSYQWVKCPGYTPLVNDTNRILNAPSKGYFAVIISNGLCKDTSDCRYGEPTTGISEKSFSSNNIKLYPNPFSTSATLEFDNSQAKAHQLSVYNALGQLVIRIENIKSNKLTIERKELQNGFYFYQLRNEEEIIGSGKIVIE